MKYIQPQIEECCRQNCRGISDVSNLWKIGILRQRCNIRFYFRTARHTADDNQPNKTWKSNVSNVIGRLSASLCWLLTMRIPVFLQVVKPKTDFSTSQWNLKSSTWLDILHWIRCLFQNFNYSSIFNFFQFVSHGHDWHRYYMHVRGHWKALYKGSELETGHWIMMLRGISHPAGKPVDLIRLSQHCNLSLFQLSQASHVKSSSNQSGNAMTSRLELGSGDSVSIRRASSNVREHAWEDVC